MPAELATTLAPTEADRLLQAEAVVRGYCKWHIAPERTEDMTLEVRGLSALVLNSLHVTEITAVTDDGETVAADDYYWSEAGVLTHRCGVWSGRKVVVSLTHGYAEVPPEVTAIVQSVAQRAVNNPASLVRTQDGPFSETYSQAGFNVSLPIALLDAEKAILDRYRLPSRP